MKNNKDHFATDPEFKEEIMKQLQLNISEKKDEHEAMFRTVVDSFKDQNLLSTFSFESGDDIEEAILHSIIKLKDKKIEEQHGIFEKQEILDLALTWNRYDIAQKYILKSQILDVK